VNPASLVTLLHVGMRARQLPPAQGLGGLRQRGQGFGGLERGDGVAEAGPGLLRHPRAGGAVPLVAPRGALAGTSGEQDLARRSQALDLGEQRYGLDGLCGGDSVGIGLGQVTGDLPTGLLQVSEHDLTVSDRGTV